MSEKTAQRVKLGTPDEFDSFPAEVVIEGKRFFVGRRGGEYVLLSSRCPHRGGPVLAVEDGLECPMHGWSFDEVTGEADTRFGDGLESFEIDDSGEMLTAQLADEAIDQAHPAREMPSATSGDADVAIEPTSCIGDVLDALGEPAVDLFHQYGFACLGCALADEETIRRAAHRHGLSDEEMDEVLDALRTIRDEQHRSG